MTTLLDAPVGVAPASFFLGWDHVEWWVGNARAFAGFLSSMFGFTITAYAGPETGVPDRASYLCEQGDVRFVVTGALDPESPIAAHVRAHGDGVRDLAVRVSSARPAFDAAVARGAPVVRHPWVVDGITRATIGTYGETVHTLVQRPRVRGSFLPGFSRVGVPAVGGGPAVGLRAIDHCVGNVEQGALERWVAYYRDVIGMKPLVHFGDDQISTEYSALMSTVVWDGSRVVLPLNEPADGLKRSQVQEYLDFYRGPGVQHIALRTDDIIVAVSALRARGVRVLSVPDTYYADVRARLSDLRLPWDRLRELGVLVDRDEDGYLLQVFTEMVTDRPTVFFEIIQREGAKGFGAGNFKALFEAIEREQERRGNL